MLKIIPLVPPYLLSLLFKLILLLAPSLSPFLILAVFMLPQLLVYLKQIGLDLL